MEQRLLCGAEGDGGLRQSRWTVTEFHSLELCYVFGECRCRQQRIFRPHLLHYLLLFHLRGPLEFLGESLMGETFTVDILYHIVGECNVFYHHQRVGRQEFEKRNLVCHNLRQFRYDRDAVHLTSRQLRLHLEGAY